MIMEREYVIITWPESQALMDKEWYEECVLINEEPLLNQVGSAAYFVPKSRTMKVGNDIRLQS